MGRKKEERGVTLMELMVVITIIGVLMTAIGIGVYVAFARAKIKTASLACNRMRHAAQLYATDHMEDAECPTPERLMETKELDEATSIVDPWGTGYRIECTADSIIASSAGPDRVFGSEDDIKVPGPRKQTNAVATPH